MYSWIDFIHSQSVYDNPSHFHDNYNLVKRIYTSFKNLHYESPTLNDPLGVMYSIPASRVHELRGEQHLTSLTDPESIAIVRLASSIAAPNTVLDVLRTYYIKSMETRKKRTNRKARY